MDLTEADIQTIIQSVLENVESALGDDKQQKNIQQPIQMKTISPHEQESRSSKLREHENEGIFEDIEHAIDAAYHAQIDLIKNYQLKDRERMISSIRESVLAEKETLARLVLDETKIGKYEDKLAKLELTIQKTPGTEDLKTSSVSGDDGLTFEENAPFGLIGAVTPVTNPSETIINNTLGMIASGNSVVLNVHPSSVETSKYVVTLINKAIQAAGGPKNLVTMVKQPTLDTLKSITNSSKVKLLVGTGGPGMVKALLQSGKKAIGAGAGNPPVIVDETAHLKQAAKSIIEGAAFDNNLLCIAEKEVFVLDSIADDLIFELLNEGAYMLNVNQLQNVMDFALEKDSTGKPGGCSYQKRDYIISKDWVGKDVSLFLEKLNVQEQNKKLLICDVDFHHPFVQLEQLMPVLPIVRVKDISEAIDKAVAAEHGNRHTAVIHSNNLEHITKFAQAIDTTLFINNSSSLAGVGFGGEGHTTMTIAGPTGEGVTSAKTFTRKRRSVIANGGLNIIG